MENLVNKFKLELRSLIVLALPLMMAQLFQSLINFTDIVMAGNVSSVDLAGVSVGSSIWGAWFIFIIGTLMAVSPWVAQLRGAGKTQQIGAFVHQALWLSVALGIITFFLMRNAEIVLRKMDVDPKIIPMAVEYLKAFSWGAPAITIFIVLRYFSEALFYTKPVMVVLFISLVCNAFGNYIFIYGKFGLPALGGVGCGWASAIASWLTLLSMIIVIRLPAYRETGIWQKFRFPKIKTIIEILQLGLPIGFGWFIEASIFSVIALFISILGSDIVSAHQIALNFSSLMFMIPLSISMAITVRVGHAIGEGNYDRARLSGFVGISFAIFIAFFTSAMMFVFPEQIAKIYSKDPAVIELAGFLLIFAAVFQISDAIQVSTLGALRGYKDTQIPMLITVISYWLIGFPLGYSLGLTSYIREPMGAQGFWIGLVAGLTAAAILLSWRLRIISKQTRVYN